MIVEDEYFVRKGVRNLIDYEAFNCTVVKEAQNGEEALEILKDTHVDIVITDVKMPVLDGIGLLKETLDQDLIFIILSGFSEFKYAQEAIRLGVSSYLLKPVEREDLEDALEKAKQDLNLRRLSLKLEDQREKVNDINLLKVYENKTIDDLVNLMIDYVREHYASKFTMEDLVEKLHYSESTLNQRFRKAMDMTFNNFLNQYRIQKAMDLMAAGYDAHEVYADVGFSEYKYFRIVFKKFTGISPSVYKKSLE